MLGDGLVGVYVHGSLALDAFDPGRSDVDFLVATDNEPTPADVERLDRLHRVLGDRLDGSYLPLDVFRRFDPERVMHPHIEARGGRLFVDHHGGETVVYRYVLRKSGIVVAGPLPRDLIDPVSADELRWGVCDVLTNWWTPLLVDLSEPLFDTLYRVYAVVTMCRARYTLTTGDVTSKPEAARWALTHVEPKWHDLIRRAAARGECSYDETVAFVRATIALASC